MKALNAIKIICPKCKITLRYEEYTSEDHKCMKKCDICEIDYLIEDYMKHDCIESLKNRLKELERVNANIFDELKILKTSLPIDKLVKAFEKRGWKPIKKERKSKWHYIETENYIIYGESIT